MNWPVVENDKMTYDLSGEKGLLGTHADIVEALAEYAGMFTYATITPLHKISPIRATKCNFHPEK